MVSTTKLSPRAAKLMAELEATETPLCHRRWTNEEVEFIRAARDRGFTARQIAVKLETSIHSIQNLFKRRLDCYGVNNDKGAKGKISIA
jgi:DNA-binding NarL/FixJ family response regulator